jgi:Flp pilus assembly protein TadG
MIRRKREGANVVEFGLWLPVLAILFSGIVDVSWLMSRYHNVARAARDGARVGVSIIEDEDSTPGDEMEAVAKSHAEAILNGVGMTCDTRCTVVASLTTVSSSDVLEVDVTYTYEPLIGLLPLGSSTLHSTFTMMVQQQTGA